MTATGSNLTYQWRKNGAAIPGATSATFTIASASEADAGSYDCVVSNPATSETSTAAVLTVQALAGWFTANGLTGADAAPEANPAGDGISNLLKYAFNMDPNTAYSGNARHLTAGSGQSGLPSITTSKPPGGQRLRIEFVRRRNDNSLGYQAQFSIDNTIWVPAVAAPTVTVIDADWERVVVEDLLDAWPTRFGRVGVYLAE